MPNGTVAPGKVWPSGPVPMKGSTNASLARGAGEVCVVAASGRKISAHETMDAILAGRRQMRSAFRIRSMAVLSLVLHFGVEGMIGISSQLKTLAVRKALKSTICAAVEFVQPVLDIRWEKSRSLHGTPGRVGFARDVAPGSERRPGNHRMGTFVRLPVPDLGAFTAGDQRSWRKDRF